MIVNRLEGRDIPTPTIDISPALPLAKKSEYFTVDNAAQMYSSNRARKSSSLPRNLGLAFPLFDGVYTYVVRCPSGWIVSFARNRKQGAHTIISLLDCVYDIIHPPPISRCKADHSFSFRICEIERNILNLLLAFFSTTHMKKANIDQNIICAVSLLSDDLICCAY